MQNKSKKNTKKQSRSPRSEAGDFSRQDSRAPKADNRTSDRSRPRSAGNNAKRVNTSRDGIVYGVHASMSVLANPNRKIKTLHVSKECYRRHQEEIDAGLNRQEVETLCFEVTMRDLDDMLGADTVHQGILLEALPLEHIELEDLPPVDDVNADCLLLVLDQVTDPHNVGAILRSAAVFNAAAVIVHDRASPPMTATLLKIASGAGEHIPLIRVTNVSRSLQFLEEQGFTTIGLAAEGEMELSEIPKTNRTALVMGAEGSGIRRLVRENCSTLARLPCPGPLDHLNVSNAAAVSLYEFTRK